MSEEEEGSENVEAQGVLHTVMETVEEAVEGVVKKVADFVENTEETLEDEYEDAMSPKPKLFRKLRNKTAKKSKSSNKSAGGIMVLGEFKPPSERDKLEFVKLNHPWNKEKNRPYRMSEVQFGSGWPFCCRKRNFRENEVFGGGVVSYFKLLKAYMRFFFVLFLLTLPLQFFNYVASDKPSFLSLTMGNLYQEETVDEDFFEFPLGYGACGSDDTCTIKKSTLFFVYIFIDCFIVMCFLTFNEYILNYLRRADLEINKYEPSIEQYTIEVKRLPAGSSYETVLAHFESLFGGESDRDSNAVYDVQLVTETRDQLHLVLRHGKITTRFKRKKAELHHAQTLREQGKISQRQIERLEARLARQKERLDRFWQSSRAARVEGRTRHILRAYVTFNSRTAYLECLRAYNPGLLQRLRGCNQGNEKLAIQGRKPSVQRAASPENIIWEHQEYPLHSRCLRSALSFLLTAVIIVASAALLTYIENAAETINAGFGVGSSVDCSQVNANLTASNQTQSCEEDSEAEVCLVLKLCACLSLTEGFEVFTENPECAPLFAVAFFSETAGTAVVVTLFNVLLQYFIGFSVRFEKKLDLRWEENSKQVRFFIAAFVNAAVIILIKEMDVEAITGVAVPYFDRGTFIDFNADWYNAVGTEVSLIVVGNMLGIHIFHLLEYTLHRLRRCMHRPLSQADLNRLHLGHSFYLSIRYAQFMVTVFLVLSYSSCMPGLYVFVSASFIVAYAVDKYLLLQFYRTPARLSNASAIKAVRSFRWAAALHLVMGIWAYTSPEIFPDSVAESQSTFLTQFSDGITEQIVNETGFQLYDPDKPYTRFLNPNVVPLLLLLVLIPFWSLLVRNLLKCLQSCGCCGSSNKRIRATIYNGMQADMSEEEMKAAMNARTMQELSDEEQIVGLESYNILSNPAYWNSFQLKEGVTIIDLLNDHQVHSTSDVMEYLEKGETGIVRVFHNDV